MKAKRIITAIVCILLGIVMYLKSGAAREVISGEFVRGAPNEESSFYIIDAEVSDEVIPEIEIEIPVRKYTYEELNRLSELKVEGIIQKMLLDNENTESIEEDVLFFSEYEGVPFNIMWTVSDPGLFDDEGKLLTEEPFNTVINLTLSYESFSKDYSIPIHANPGQLAKKRLLRAQLEEEIKEALQDREANAMISDDCMVRLPESVNGKHIDYYTPEKTRNPICLLFGIGMAIVLDFAFRRDRKEQEAKICEKLVCEYPGLVRKMCMYLPTGTTLRGIWSKIYENEYRRGKGEERICIEMGILINELRNGIPENEAYINFAKRLKMPQYIRFAALLTQNLKRGSTKLGVLLREEAKTAYEEKKRRACKKGEEAGTRLLMPMMLLLTDVMLLILIPAFRTI